MISAEARERVELAKQDELVTDYDVDVKVVLEGRLDYYTSKERKARTKVTRSTTALAKSWRRLGWQEERNQDTFKAQLEVKSAAEKLAGRIERLCEVAHEIRELNEALDFIN